MPFANTEVYNFNKQTIDRVNRVGGVYGLACPMSGKPGWYTILYVGKTGDLNERLCYHYNNPPVAGITHFFVEAIPTDAVRTRREEQLISEFKPVGNTLKK